MFYRNNGVNTKVHENMSVSLRNRSLLPNRLCTALLLPLLVSPCGAEPTITVYRSVDLDGQVHFSDRPPETTVGNVEIIHLPAQVPVTVPESQQIIAEMAATTERLREDRLRRSEERAPKSSSPPLAGPSPHPPPVYHRHDLIPYRYGRPPGPWRHPPPEHHQPTPDNRTERDRRRDDMRGTWYIPRQLPDLSRPSSRR